MLNKKKEEEMQVGEVAAVVEEQQRMFVKTGHMCMVCGFRATTKNKYRELQDHLVRQHFQDRIKAALPTKRPFVCPDASCSVEGKDWQALMRHYTGKHGILESYLKEVIASGLVSRAYRENVKKPRISALNPILDDHYHQDNKENGHKAARSSRSLKRRKKRMSDSSGSTESSGPEGNNNKLFDHDPLATTSSVAMDQVMEEVVDDTDVAENPTHLALVLKQQKVDLNGLEMPPEETYAFVDLKYFMPVSANRYIFKGPSLEDPQLSDSSFCIPAAASTAIDSTQQQQHYTLPQMPLLTHQNLGPAREDYPPHLYHQPPPVVTSEAGGGVFMTADEQQTMPDSTTPAGFYQETTYHHHHHHQSSTILIPPESVSPSLTISNELQSTMMISDSTSSYLSNVMSPTRVSPQIDLGQIVRQTIETSANGGALAAADYVMQSAQQVVDDNNHISSPLGSQLYSIPLGQYPDMTTASAEAAEAALVPSTSSTADCLNSSAREGERVLVEEAKIINIEGAIINHHQTELLNGSCSEVASTVTVVSCSEGDTTATTADASEAALKSESNGETTSESGKEMKEIEFSLF